MTKLEWDNCTEPIRMLDFLRETEIASERKLRLFVAACCRRGWHRLDAAGQAVAEASERLADGLVSEAEVRAAVWASRGVQDIDARTAVDHGAVGAWRPAVTLLADVCVRPLPADPSAPDRERRAQANILRCVLGPLPFRSPEGDPRWRTPLVLSLAQAAYDERVAPDPSRPGWLILDPARLLVLADALEDAGADEPEILEHLRGPGEHVRGCHVVDLIS
jgi:hypothetical protein